MIQRLARFAGILAAASVALLACAPAASTTQNGGGNAPAPAAPKNMTIINSGIPAGLDNRFVVTTNNAAGIVVPLYQGALIFSDGTAGTKQAKLAEAVPSLDNGQWKVFPDNTMETRLTIRPGTV